MPETPTFTRQDDGRITVEGCDPDEVYLCVGEALLALVEEHNRLVGKVAALENSLCVAVEGLHHLGVNTGGGGT